MKLILIKYLLLLLLTVSLSDVFPQENYKENFSQDYLKPNILKNPLQLKEVSLLNHFTNFINPQKANVYDNLTIIDSIITYGAAGGKNKLTYAYDENGRIKSYLILYLQNNEWENLWQITNDYDSSGNLLNTLYEFWNGNLWEYDSFQTFYYDSDGNDTLQLVSLWEGNNWQNMLRTSNSYDSIGNIITSTTERWIDNLWINDLKITLNYYPNGERDFNLVELWNGSNWEYFLLVTFKYTNNWELLSILIKIWEGNIWNNNSRISFTYSLDEPQLIGLNEVWANNQWIVDSRYSYSYNANGYFTHGIYELWENGNWIPVDAPMRIENPDGFIEYLWTYEAFVYYGKPTNVETEGNILLKDFELSQNYPNPFNPTTKIKFTIPTVERFAESLNNAERIGNSLYNVTIRVYDVLGNEVAILVNEEKPAGSYEVKFSAADLPSGVYFYRLTINNFSKTKKMLLLR